MWTMSSASDSNWSPQPPNLQQLEKKEAAAMPVMSAALVHSPGEQEEEEEAAVEVEVWRRRRRGQTGKPGPVEAVEEAGCRGPRVRGGWSTAAAAAAADTDRAARQDTCGRSWEAGGRAGGTVGVRMGGGRAGRHYVTGCLPVGEHDWRLSFNE